MILIMQIVAALCIYRGLYKTVGYCNKQLRFYKKGYDFTNRSKIYYHYCVTWKKEPIFWIKKEIKPLKDGEED